MPFKIYLINEEKKSVKMIQSQTEFLHRPNLEILRGNSQCPIPLKISRFGKTKTISESGEFDGESITRI